MSELFSVTEGSHGVEVVRFMSGGGGRLDGNKCCGVVERLVQGYL